MKTVLVVEDEQLYVELYKDIFDRIGFDTGRCAFFTNAEEASSWINKYGENLATAFLDLKIPKDRLGRISDQELAKGLESRYGFEVFKDLRKKNRICDVVIVSNYADETREREIVIGLRRQGLFVDSILHKQFDLDMENLRGINRFRNYLQPVDKEMRLLESAGIYAKHPYYEKLVRQMKFTLKEQPDAWPAPFFLFKGLPGSGKNNWARALAILKAQHSEDYVFEQESMGAFTSPQAGDAVGLRLFGARNYNRLNSAGLFERATRYRDRAAGLAQTQDCPDYTRSGVAFLDELDSAPFGVIDTLLNVMSEGNVNPCGLNPAAIKIGCAMVFASIQGEGLLAGGEGMERGAGSLEAFFKRFPSVNRIRLPSLQDLGKSFAIDFLNFKAGRAMMMAPPADDLLEEGISSGAINLRELSMLRIPDGTRITYEEVFDIFPHPDGGAGGSGGGASHRIGEPPSMEEAKAWAWLDALQKACTEVLLEGDPLSKTTVGDRIVTPGNGRKGVTPQRVGQIFNSEEFSDTLRRLLDEYPKKWPDVHKIV